MEPFTSTAGKIIVGKALDRFIKKAADTEQNLKDNFRTLGQELKIYCPEDVMKVSTSIEAKRKLLGKKKFPGKIINAELRSLIPPRPIPRAIRKLPDGFEVIYRKLPQDVETFILEVDYEIEDPRFMKSLVNVDKPDETPKEDTTEYWLVAQLRELESLWKERKIDNVEIRDLDFAVNVGVHQDLKTTIPHSFKEETETIVDWIKSRDREEKHRLSLKHVGMKQGKPKKSDILFVLGELQKLFMPRRFKKYIDVSQDFHYSDCRRGTDIEEGLPFQTWPKFMEVISRTNLSREEPAAEGKLIYKQSDFKKAVENFFSDHSYRD